MDLIIGGAYQGKCTFAAEKYRLTAADICDLQQTLPPLPGAMSTWRP